MDFSNVSSSAAVELKNDSIPGMFSILDNTSPFTSSNFDDSSVAVEFSTTNTTVPADLHSSGFCPDSFWDTELLISSSWPRFTQCFQDTVLVYVPFACFWLGVPPYLYYLATRGNRPLPISCLTLMRMFLAGALALVSVILIVEDASNNSEEFPVPWSQFVANIIRVISYAMAMLLLHAERKHHVTTSGVLFLLWMLLVLCDVVPMYSKILLEEYKDMLLRFVLFALIYAMEVLQLLLTVGTDSTGIESLNDKTSPEVTASFPSQVFYGWVSKTVYRGWKRDLTEEDLFDLNPRDTSDTLVPNFEGLWIRETVKMKRKRRHGKGLTESHKMEEFSQSSDLTSESQPLLANMNGKFYEAEGKTSGASQWRSVDPATVNSTAQDKKSRDKKKQQRPSLLRVLTRMVGGQLVIGLIQKIVSDVFLMLSPVLLSLLISYADNKETDYVWKGYTIAVLLFVTQMFKSVLFNFSFWSSQIVGMQMKTTLIAAIYKKALTMNNEAKKESTAGEIVSLMSVDCQRVQDVMNFFFFAWTTPIQVAIAIAVLYQYVGVSVFAGLAVLLLTVPFNSYIAGKQQILQRKNLRHKDARLRLTNEALSGMKVLKLYAWEPPFQTKISDIRNAETKVLLHIAYLNALISVCFNAAPYLIMLTTFAVYVNISDENHLDANKAFVALSFFNLLRVPLALLSTIISMSVQAVVSIERINDFLCTGDLKSNNITKDSRATNAISVEKATFTWDKSTSPCLRNISLKIPIGNLFAVVGPVGSGKSSLMSALLGEMERVSGTACIKSTVAYVPQQAWIQNATVKDNILFGKPFNKRKYKKVLYACALERDLEILSAGDMTEIGEKGINLSGGQKQRVSLARAVYNDADIYIFDDPLSAVDTHVGKHIFNHVVGEKGVLKDKTRVLVTHGAHWLPMVDSIIVLDGGEISEAGSYEDLMSHNGPFAEFIRTYLLQSEDDLDIDPEMKETRSRMWTDVESASDAGLSGDELTTVPRRQRLGKKARKWSSLLKQSSVSPIESSTEEVLSPLMLPPKLADENPNDHASIKDSYEHPGSTSLGFFVPQYQAGDGEIEDESTTDDTGHFSTLTVEAMVHDTTHQTDTDIPGEAAVALPSSSSSSQLSISSKLQVVEMPGPSHTQTLSVKKTKDTSSSNIKAEEGNKVTAKTTSYEVETTSVHGTQDDNEKQATAEKTDPLEVKDSAVPKHTTTTEVRGADIKTLKGDNFGGNQVEAPVSQMSNDNTGIAETTDLPRHETESSTTNESGADPLFATRGPTVPEIKGVPLHTMSATETGESVTHDGRGINEGATAGENFESKPVDDHHEDDDTKSTSDGFLTPISDSASQKTSAVAKVNSSILSSDGLLSAVSSRPSSQNSYTSARGFSPNRQLRKADLEAKSSLSSSFSEEKCSQPAVHGIPRPKDLPFKSQKRSNSKTSSSLPHPMSSFQSKTQQQPGSAVSSGTVPSTEHPSSSSSLSLSQKISTSVSDRASSPSPLKFSPHKLLASVPSITGSSSSVSPASTVSSPSSHVTPSPQSSISKESPHHTMTEASSQQQSKSPEKQLTCDISQRKDVPKESSFFTQEKVQQETPSNTLQEKGILKPSTGAQSDQQHIGISPQKTLVYAGILPQKDQHYTAEEDHSYADLSLKAKGSPSAQQVSRSEHVTEMDFGPQDQPLGVCETQVILKQDTDETKHISSANDGLEHILTIKSEQVDLEDISHDSEIEIPRFTFRKDTVSTIRSIDTLPFETSTGIQKDSTSVTKSQASRVSFAGQDSSTDTSPSKFSHLRTMSTTYESSMTTSQLLLSQTIIFDEEVANRTVGKLVETERMETGKVKLAVFWSYAKAAGVLAMSMSLLFFALFQAASAWSNFWLTDWTEDPFLANTSLAHTAEYKNKNDYYLWIFGLFGIVQIGCLSAHNIIYWIRIVIAAKRLHLGMLTSLLRSPMSFFDTTPVGRIMNRFSRDIEVVDNNLPIIIRDYTTTFFIVLVTIIIISISTPLFLSLMVPIMIAYYFIQNFYIPTSRQLKRIESVTRSPIYTHFSETISGGPTIRAYEATTRFIKESKVRVDRNQSFYYISLAANRWLGMSLEVLANTIILGSAIFAVVTPDITGGDVGLSVSYAIQISSNLVWMVRQMSDLETNIVSVERLKEYSELESEAKWIIPRRRPVLGWPQEGSVKFNDYMTRYRAGLDLVLKGITCEIKAGEKIGIVGRTGAGKSSLALALFRLIEASGGSIVVDGINIADTGLHDVRSQLTILPQDPVLFFGTLRMNLDPVEEYDDHDLWMALTSAHLRDFVDSLPEGLDYEVGEEGQSLSVGQRQLVCLARALLKKTKILILDEATAAVDMETDTLIQNTIRSEFENCTIITIAHRLNTIMDYDRIMVLDAGEIKELDSPANLLADKESVFYSMAKEANLV